MIRIAAPQIDTEEQQAVKEVLESGILADGAHVRRFEQEFANYHGATYGVATSSGTTALHVALLASGISLGDKIITTPFTFIATANSILYCRAKPIFADIDPASGNLSLESVKQLLKQHSRVRAILLVHLYGLPCDMIEFSKLAQEYNLILIEDCAQAHGAMISNQKVGTFGKSSAFSFYPTKNMTTGEGGIVITNNQNIADLSRIIVNHGSSIKYQHEVLGFNYRMTNIAAAIGLAQLNKLENFTEQRRRNASFLSKSLANVDWLQCPTEPTGYRHVYHQYTIKLRNCQVRDKLSKFLKEKEIETAIHYPIPLHKQPFYEQLGYDCVSLPFAEELSGKILSLPIHPGLTQENLSFIVEKVKEFGDYIS